MIDYFSGNTPDKLMLRVVNISESTNKRMELIEESFPVQLSLRNLENGLKVKAHRHPLKKKFSENPIEAWMVFSGTIAATIFENDGTEVYKIELKPFDLAIFYSGGHALEVIEGPSTMLEIKTGPYEGVENDKVLLD
jgi:hypothetical protein